jgi:hypothetical protein
VKQARSLEVMLFLVTNNLLASLATLWLLLLLGEISLRGRLLVLEIFINKLGLKICIRLLPMRKSETYIE